MIYKISLYIINKYCTFAQKITYMKKVPAILSILLFSSILYGQQDRIQTDSVVSKTIEEVVATGTRTMEDSRLLPLTVNIVTEEKLNETHTPNILPTLIEQVPGMFVTSRGVLGYGVSTGGSGGIKIRGIGSSPNTDVLVLIDGLPQYAGLYGHPISDAYQTYMAERVEVVRGPGTMLYGSNAMGGVINITTRNLRKDTLMSNVHLRGGSYYTLDAGLGTEFRKGKFNTAIGANYSRTNGHRDNMRFSETNAFVRLGYDFTQNWSVNLTGNYVYFNSQNPGTVTAPILESNFKITRGMAALSLVNNYDKVNGAIRVYYNGGNHHINEGHQAEAAAPLTEYHHKDFMMGVSAYETVKFFRGNNTTFGFDYQHFGGHAWNQAIADGTQTDLANKKEYELAAYFDFRQRVTSWFSLDAGVRFDWHSRCGFEYAPQGGFSFMLPYDIQLKLLASRGFRNPTIREMYMYKPQNAELKAVSMWNYEFSYRQHFSENNITLGLNAFYLHAQNNIETRMIDGTPKNVNTGEMKNAGAEAEFMVEIVKGLNLNANYSYLFMKYPTIAAPEHKLNLSLNYHHERFAVGTSLQAIFGLYKQVGENPLKEDFVLWNAHASYRIWKGLWAQLRAENLLAQEYEINLGFPLPKTTIIGGLEWKF